MAKSKKLTPLQKHRAETAAANEKGHPAVKKPRPIIPGAIITERDPETDLPIRSGSAARLVSGRGGGKSRAVKRSGGLACPHTMLMARDDGSAACADCGRDIPIPRRPKRPPLAEGSSVWDNLEGGLPSRRDR
jgi:hypothetical protein